MSRLLLLASVLVLAACDAIGPEANATDPTNAAALVGSWTLTDRTTDLYVTSRVDQTVLDINGRASGSLTVRGTVTDDLRYVMISDGPEGRENLSVTSLDPENTSGATSWSSLSLRRTPTKAEARLSHHAGGVTTVYTADLDRSSPPFAYNEGQFTAPTVTLTATDGSGEQVHLGGSLRLPTVALRAGSEIRVHSQPYGLVEDERITWMFGEDGAFEYRRRVPDWGGTRIETFPGTWSSEAPGALTIDADPVSLPERLTFEAAARSLRLIDRGDDDECTADCRALEANLFAAPGSFEASRSEVLFAFDAAR